MNTDEMNGQYSFPIQIGNLLFEIFFDEGFFSRSDWQVDVHNHPDYELQIIIDGRETVYFGSQYTMCDKEDMYMIHPNVFHKQVDASEEHLQKYCFRFNYKKCGNLTNQDQNIVRILSSFKMFHTKCSRLIINQIESIQTEINNKRLGFFNVTQGMLIILLMDIFRSFPTQSFQKPAEPLIEEDNRYNKIDHFFAFRYSDNPKSHELADIIHVSQSQLNRILTKKYHVSFTQKLIASKIEAAKVLLTTTNFSIQQIAEKVGYQETSSFCMIFKKKTGFSPESYRKLHNN